MLQVTDAGVVTAHQPQGEATITAELTGIGTPRSTREMVILPAGTFRLVGFVREAEAPSQPIPGARVEVPGTPLASTTDASGQYRLYGVPAQTTIVVSLSGTLNGALNIWDSRFPNVAALQGGCCTSSSHQFTLTPR